jgi:hypothetical protein
LNQTKDERTCFQRTLSYLAGILKVIDYLTPHRTRMPRIVAEFAKDVGSFFQTYRFLNMLSIVNLLAFLSLYAKQNFDFSTWEARELDRESLCGFIPCFCLYSGFDPSLALAYSLHVFTFLLIGSVSSLLRQVQTSKADIEQNLYSDQKFPVAKMILNSWDWNLASFQEKKDKSSSLLSEVRFKVNRAEMLEEINKRSTKDTYILYLRRFVSKTLNFSLLLGGMFLIILTQDRTVEIMRWATRAFGDEAYI